MSIYQICTVYYMVYDKWDTKWTHKAYNIIDNYILKLHKPKGSHTENATTAFLTTIVDKGVHCWKFNIINKYEPITTSLTSKWMRFGIIIADKSKYAMIRDYWFGCRKKTAYIWDYGNQKIIKHDFIEWGKSYGQLPKNGDNVSMYLDFNKATLSFSVNGESLGIAHNIDATKKYRGGAALSHADDKIELISYHKL